MTQTSIEALFDRDYGIVIGGERRSAASGEAFATLDPATGSVLTEVPRGRAEDVDDALNSAHAAFRASSWAGLGPFERGRLLHGLGQLLADAEDELATLESLDTGKPLPQARADVGVAVRYFEFFAGIAEKVEGTQLPLGSGRFAIGERVP